jgi:hypothetical protein
MIPARSSPYRESARDVSPTDGKRIPELDAEIVIVLCCATVLGIDLSAGQFGVPETIAMLGLGFSLRAIVTALLSARGR